MKIFIIIIIIISDAQMFICDYTQHFQQNAVRAGYYNNNYIVVNNSDNNTK